MPKNISFKYIIINLIILYYIKQNLQVAWIHLPHLF
jgi:hypothetical protein